MESGKGGFRFYYTRVIFNYQFICVMKDEKRRERFEVCRQTESVCVRRLVDVLLKAPT